MSYIRGNTPKCFDCKYYTETVPDPEPKQPNMTGWCLCKYELARGINGHKLKKPPKRRQMCGRVSACKSWIDGATGMTRYEAVTGKKEEHHAE